MNSHITEHLDKFSGEIVLSIILPTRNAGEEIYWTIESILLSNDKRLELIVVNNNFPEFQNFQKYYSDSRFKEVKTYKRLSMSENWQFGLKQSQGDWVMFVGSDDGIVSKNLSRAIDLLMEHTEKWSVLQFRSLGFVYSMNGRNPWVEIPQSKPTSKVKRVSSPKSLAALLPSQLSSLIPIPYGNSVCKRTTLQPFLNLDGGIPGFAPDFFLGFFLAERFNRFLFVDLCLPIRGLSDNSNGYQYLNQIQTQNSQEFLLDVNEKRKQSLNPELMRCRPLVAIEDRFLAAKYANVSINPLLLHFLVFIRILTCLDGNHHKSALFISTLKFRRYVISRFGYLLRKIWLLTFRIKTSKLRNYKLTLESNENVLSVQSKF